MSRSVEWSSDDEDVATVSPSGLVTFVGVGTANITASLSGNALVYDTVPVETVSSPPNIYTIEISPLTNYVLEGSATTFNAHLYLDGVLQPDAFVFTLIPNSVPSNRYVFSVIDGNSFSVKNVEMYLLDDLEVQCVSGANSKTISISLKGGWV